MQGAKMELQIMRKTWSKKESEKKKTLSTAYEYRTNGRRNSKKEKKKRKPSYVLSH